MVVVMQSVTTVRLSVQRFGVCSRATTYRRLPPLDSLRAIEQRNVYDFAMALRTTAYPQILYLIAAFKLVKGLLLLAVAIGALRLLHRDAAGRGIPLGE